MPEPLSEATIVRAIIDGRKTQTRRVVKPQPPEGCSPIEVGFHCPIIANLGGVEMPGDEHYGASSYDGEWSAKCPYGTIGDRLWVRETWGIADIDDGPFEDDPEDGPYTSRAQVVWRADDAPYRDYALPSQWARAPQDDVDRWWDKAQAAEEYGHDIWFPSIHMPRWASRITLEITGVRVERVQIISEADARAEGMQPNWAGDLAGWNSDEHGFLPYDADDEGNVPGCDPYDSFTARDCFARLWDSINASRPGCSWGDNPWVWVVEFRRVEGEVS